MGAAAGPAGAPVRPAGRSRSRVVGGGPAGLTAAAAAAGHGHTVRLVERSADLGGQLRLAASAPGRDGLLGLIDAAAAERRPASRHASRLAT